MKKHDLLPARLTNNVNDHNAPNTQRDSGMREWERIPTRVYLLQNQEYEFYIPQTCSLSWLIHQTSMPCSAQGINYLNQLLE